MDFALCPRIVVAMTAVRSQEPQEEEEARTQRGGFTVSAAAILPPESVLPQLFPGQLCAFCSPI